MSGANIARASEIDDVSTYYGVSADAKTVLNRRVQEAFDKGLAKMKSNCDLNELSRAIAEDLVSFRYYSGAFETFAKKSTEIERLAPALNLSIYRESSFSSSIIGRTYGLDPSIVLSGTRVGTDKLGHFMDHGYKLYELSRSGKTLHDLIRHATEEEEGAFGLVTTGVKSYGDIASAFDGYRFWKAVQSESREAGQAPYFRCENGSFEQIRKFDFDDYVSKAWSEAINCNDYHSWSFGEEVKRNAEALEKKEGRRFTCPIVTSECPKLYVHYEQWLPSVDVDLMISKKCPRKVEPQTEL